MGETTVIKPHPGSDSGSVIDVTNPQTGEKIYSLTEFATAEVEEAFVRARAAHETIKAMSVSQRLAELAKLKRYFLDNKDHVVNRVVEETGKSKMDALTSEVFTILDMIDYYEKNAEDHLRPLKVKTPVILMPKKSKIYYEPIGPVLIISPWNYPMNLAWLPILTAFVAGNAVVFKPSEWTPLKGLIEDIVRDSGFMKEAIQVVYGGKDVGRRLIDQKPARIMFTGSTRAGKEIMKQAADHLIPVELELGGKDPMVIFDDANVDRAAHAAAWGGILNCGQTCTSVERVLVQDKVYDEFVANLTGKLGKLSTVQTREGVPDEGDMDVGVMTAPFQVEKVVEQIEDAKAKGATIQVGGERVGQSHCVQPTLITDVDNTMKVVTEETFGPVISVQKFSTEDDAIRMANDTEYGLSASVWSADTDRADRIGRNIETGNVSINNVLATQANSALPYGGTKESGFGRYKGPHGLHAFSNIKSVLIDGTSQREIFWYPYSKEKYVLMSKMLDAIYDGGPLWLLKLLPTALKLQGMAKKSGF